MRLFSGNFHFSRLLLVAAAAAAFWGCAKEEEEDEETDALLGVYVSGCEALFTADQIADTDFCNAVDNISGTQATPEENVAACTEKYENYFYKDTVTFRDAAKAIDVASGAVLTETAAVAYNQMVYSRTSFSDEDCTETVATLDRAFTYQKDPATINATDDPANSGATKGFPADAKALNFQLTQAALTYHTDGDDVLENTQSRIELCEEDGWEEDEAVDITNKDNCEYYQYLFTDNLGDDTGYNLGVMTSAGGNTVVSYIDPPALWIDSTEDVLDSSFVSGNEMYTIYKLEGAGDDKTLALGNFFDFAPFGMFDIGQILNIGTDEDEYEYTNVNEDGDNDNHRQVDFGLEFDFDQELTDAL